ncbi:putative cysteine protease RD19D [Camellia lanceoleosa]|uniref:Cysteine protease RD19D n=1 Tax=Camellia lanceoleosa TaxID=1840588 RepID=A0ACC0HHX8_9ERIC|nr:putative cysteine protease RD19D [Camellia lanceoleosa]
MRVNPDSLRKDKQKVKREASTRQNILKQGKQEEGRKAMMSKLNFGKGAVFRTAAAAISLSMASKTTADRSRADKTTCNDGCSGGLMSNAYKYLMKAGGIEEEDSHPYTGKKGECKFKPEKVAVKVVNFTNVPTDEKQIAMSPSTQRIAHGLAFEWCVADGHAAVWA